MAESKTTEEVLACINNHSGDVNRIMCNLQSSVESISKGYMPVTPEIRNGMIASLKFAKSCTKTMKDAINAWEI